jgi:hypothetical protein
LKPGVPAVVESPNAAILNLVIWLSRYLVIGLNDFSNSTTR